MRETLFISDLHLQPDTPEIAREIYRTLKQQWNVFYDERGSIGRRHRRQNTKRYHNQNHLYQSDQQQWSDVVQGILPAPDDQILKVHGFPP